MKPHRRYAEEEKEIVLATIARARASGCQPLSRILSGLGITRSVYYDWREKQQVGRLADRVVVPKSPLTVLPEEVKAAVEYAKIHPREGYRRLAWMMVDDDIVYLKPTTVYRILDKHDLLYRWKQPESGLARKVPVAAYPDEVWHVDLMYLWVKGRWR